MLVFGMPTYAHNCSLAAPPCFFRSVDPAFVCEGSGLGSAFATVKPLTRCHPVNSSYFHIYVAGMRSTSPTCCSMIQALPNMIQHDPT
jgi:hypothetical protein